MGEQSDWQVSPAGGPGLVAGPLRELSPLIGKWIAPPSGIGPAGRMECVRTFRPILGGTCVELMARWSDPGGGYEELALFASDPSSDLCCWSFTSDGRQSQGRRVEAHDVHPGAIAFEMQVHAGGARFVYWPADQGFYFAAESAGPDGWNRFLVQRYTAASERDGSAY